MKPTPELFADLSSLDRSHQLAYASGVFSTAWQLRRERHPRPTR